MINGLLRKQAALTQPLAVTVEEGQALAELDHGAKRKATLYTLAVVLRISFLLALILNSLTLWHW